MTAGQIRERLQKLKQKRGVVLLIVVSLLALFVLLGVSFALVASHSVTASKLEREIQRVGDPPETEADLILGQILYDTVARTSLQNHSLLQDLYGTDSVTGTLAQAPFAYDSVPSGSSGWQISRFRVTPDVGPTLPVWSTVPNYYSGRVITFLSGPAVNKSSRVLGFAYEAPSMTYPQGFYELLIESISPLPAQGDQFLINGAPLNGAGAGYDPITRNLDAILANVNAATSGTFLPGTVQTDLVALLPHFTGYDAASCRIYFDANNTAANANPVDRVALGQLDETWDAVDLQNMALAMVPPDAAQSAAAGTFRPLIPSFHRPELIQYWITRIQTEIFQPASITDPSVQAQWLAYPYGPDGVRNSSDDQSSPIPLEQRDRIYLITRGCIVRPMPWDHPNFSGSNTAFATTNPLPLFTALINSGNLPLWDVDNDNDGLPESIWIDPGLPVVTAPDGRRYKRLAAIYVQDLDGRVNLNAHGNLQQIPATAHAGLTSQYGGTKKNVGLGHDNHRADTLLPGPFGLAIPANYGTSLALPRGLGFGPAEVDFLHLFGPTNDANVRAAYGEVLSRRYESRFPFDTFADANNDNIADPRPGVPGARDWLASVKHHGVPNDFANLASLPPATWYGLPTWYGSPPDVHGRGTVVLDYGGQPLMAYMGLAGEMVDSPYELALHGEANGTDSPYTPAELERLLRYNDPDAQFLPFRNLTAAASYLGGTAGQPGPQQTLRNKLTTISSHVPAPATVIPQEQRGNLAGQIVNGNPAPKTPGNTTILDLYAAKLRAGGIADGLPMFFAMQQIVPWEFFRGQKFNINRWLGNGVDNNSDGARDDVRETIAPATETAWAPDVTGDNQSDIPQTFTNVTAEGTNSLALGNHVFRSDVRQLYARHLYCLALLFVPPNLQGNYPHEPSLGTNPRLLRRRIAQWAVNCVDFRDPDAIMTPFEFDYNPWDGWNVDGNPQTDGTAGSGEVLLDPATGNPLPPAPTADRGLVWGMEYPDLLITETLAFHDRRVKDTTMDPSGKDRGAASMPDPNLDQFRVPQGSLFVELYCPRPYNWGTGLKPHLPRELYSNGSAMPLSVGSGQSPVWRLALTKLTHPFDPTDARHPLGAALTKAESASFDPANMDLLYEAANTGSGVMSPTVATIERFAYFGPPPPGTNDPMGDRDRSFYITNGATPAVQPGQYVVVGPRQVTYLGSIDPNYATDDTYGKTRANPPMGTLWGGHSKQMIELGVAGASPGAITNGIRVTDATGTDTSRTLATGIRPCVPVVMDMQGVVPQTLTGPWDSNGIWNRPASRMTFGLNVSEPLPSQGHYYPEPRPPQVPAGEPADFYDDPDAASQGGGILDEPQDSPNHPEASFRPIASNQMTRTGTYFNVSAVFLQRLANPTVPFDSTLNPYITVDWASIDVTVFSGEEDVTQTVMGGSLDPDDPSPDSGNNLLHFRSRQRGYPQDYSATTYNPTQPLPNQSNLWPAITFPVGAQAPQDAALRTRLIRPAVGPYFSVQNQGATVARDLSNNFDGSYDARVDRHTLGYLNETLDQLVFPTNNAYPGEPAHPFPWLAWHDRPFANPMELLTVPSCSASRVTVEVTSNEAGAGQPHLTAFQASDVYDAGNENNTQTVLRSPFGHLLNFFETENVPPAGGGPARAPHLYRLLDFVEVPSPYQGTERWYNPAGGRFAGKYPFAPPFNSVSRFRDPGRININTVFDKDIWFAAVGVKPTGASQTTFADLADDVFVSRQGYGSAANLLQMNPDYPTRFANPYRAADSADLMPNVPSSGGSMRKTKPVEATLLRPSPSASGQPLLQMPQTDTSWAVANGTTFATPGHFRDINRNPYFRYQAYQKIGNIFSTTSNCYAVWITIGYFEVEPTAVDAAHPDGFVLGQELGADSGQITRHRAFYIIDRSIPVGFIPGKRLNTDECILVRRLIE